MGGSRPENFMTDAGHGAAAAVDPFYRRRDSNAYDRLVVDIHRLYGEFPVAQAAGWHVPDAGGRASRAVASLYSAPVLPVSARLAAWQLLKRLRLDQGWFERFATYWTSVLGGRPLLSPEDS
jgi:hypothetical protein